MADYPVIDAHVHTFPSREIGRQATAGASQTDYGGTVDELLTLLDRGGIENAVMVNMTPVTEMFDAAAAKLPGDLSLAQRADAEDDIRRRMIGRLQRRNEWTCQMAREHPRLLSFIGLDPSMSEDELLAEIDVRREQGAHGIKLHPPNQRFFPTDRRLWPVYERAQELGLPIIFHSGAFALGPGPSDHGHPRHFPEVLSAFPRLTVVMAHLAFGDFAACADLARAHDNVFFDCCYVINGTEKSPSLSDDEAVAALRRVGCDRVMFGSDYPWFDPVLDAQRIQRLPLADADKRAVLRDNAVRLFGL
jgi:predicted TIM-barrel fold metal-dependent hydrolase